ncbi:MAG: hypothetical protein ACFFE8_07195 [Candidatus Heimdallarchaeota archaeon]
MSTQRLFVYSPSLDGEYVPIKFNPEKDMIESEVLIFLDDEERQIFIWTGSEAPVRKRFISSQIARQMRLEKGMTFRVSTVDEGNETKAFNELIMRIGSEGTNPGPLLEVSPPVGAADLPTPTSDDLQPSKKERKKKKSKVTKAKTLAALRTQSSTVQAPPSFQKPSLPSSPTARPVPYIPTSDNSSGFYYSLDQKSELTRDDAQIIFPAKNQDVIFTTLLVSTASESGKIEFFSLAGDATTIKVKATEDPFLVIYVTPRSRPVYELDDLYIPIPKGNSIYLTCPPQTFIGVNLK